MTLCDFACSLMRGAFSGLMLMERTNSSSMLSSPRVLMCSMPLRVSLLGVLRGIPAVPKRSLGIWVMVVCGKYYVG